MDRRAELEHVQEIAGLSAATLEHLTGANAQFERANAAMDRTPA